VSTLAIAPATSCVVHACPQCHGVFVPPLAWDFFLTHPERVGELEAKLPPAPPDRGNLVASVRCPACDKEMDRLRFAGVSEIVVDTCTAAHGSWLDGGELGSVVRFLAERDAGGAGSEERRQADQAEELRTRMTTAAEEARASLRRMEVLAAASKASREGKSPWPVFILPGILLVITLSGLWQRCGVKSHAPESTSPGQRAVDRAAASSERELR
jgi:Zn-finger nucleic acid-binding protein